MMLKIQEPAERWDIVTLPLAPAPLEMPTTPLWSQESPVMVWSYPTEAKFISYPVPSYHSVWVAEALQKYRIHLTSPFDLPYTLVAKAPLSVRE